MDAIRHNHTWDIVERSTDRKIIDSKWVFQISTFLIDPAINSNHDQ
jgi:hypothetical protein